ncbi:unnamed protein product [Eruca vesicaria subsp. sativa]|uniref:MATH domain-containing protein n=1 Tax=Eruca vesicaria subsp. sativa TaxID=29727 RepID=A0ABC8LJ29_ERUVS|nr:unnamed protein product [Eruca vesicaria subsp. sativa]
MEKLKPTSFTFEIDNFWEKGALIESPKFVSGGCGWYLKVYPKGNNIVDHLSLYLHVANIGSLRLGWKRRASYSFALLNQSGKEIYRKPEFSSVFFCAQIPDWGWPWAVALKDLQENGFVEKNKLIVKVEVQVLEVVDESQVTGKKTLGVRGFQILYSQVNFVNRIFIDHPDIALNFKPKSQLVKTTYMNILLGLIGKLYRPAHSFSEAELSNSRIELADLTEAGFKLDWLKTRLDEICLVRKKIVDDSFRVKELEENKKNLKAELNMEKAKVFSLEQTVVDLKAKLNKKQKPLKAKLNKKRKLSHGLLSRIIFKCVLLISQRRV